MDKLEFSDAVNFGLDQIMLTCKINLPALSMSLLVLLICFLKLLVNMKSSSPKSSVCLQLIQMSWSDYSSSNMDTLTAKNRRDENIIIVMFDIAYEHEHSSS